MLRLTDHKRKAKDAVARTAPEAPVNAADRAAEGPRDGSLAAYGGIALVSASIGAVAVGAFAIGALAIGRQMRRRRLARLAAEVEGERRLTKRS